MDDLISRKALLEVIDISFIIPILKMNLRPEHEAVLKIREIIMNMPTAFDKEKVMEKLKHCRDYYDVNEQPKKPFDYWECADIREHKGKWMAYDDAIEIVEKGGIE